MLFMVTNLVGYLLLLVLALGVMALSAHVEKGDTVAVEKLGADGGLLWRVALFSKDQRQVAIVCLCLDSVDILVDLSWHSILNCIAWKTIGG